ncbi:glycosyltransferase [Ammoniphilus sp. 3BR4]|uniref:glycosyltransferase n=1 Tax=Ammoniphilus sp. 3BR4 TaxID=3158265 RepID=UPI0034654042
MNDKKVCFIFCVNNLQLFEESKKFISSLYVPEGYQVEVLSIKDASSMAAGYNQLMKETDAKYKVYLHQDVFILNKNFLEEIIELFTSYPQLGMLGLVGAKNLPENGVWWESGDICGKVYDSHTGKMELLHFHEVRKDYESVQAIDGLIMVTQYDIPWREDIFKGWHFYDISQSLEFIKAGYEVGIPKQEMPWCMHDCGIVNIKNGYEESRGIFLRAYRNIFSSLNDYSVHIKDTNEFPLVSVLIPAFNRPHYLEIALKSVLEQTYRNIEIIICDDSTNNEVGVMITPYMEKFTNIKYFKNENRLGGFSNLQHCFNLASGKYINFLLDDDQFHPNKIEKMISYMQNDRSITLVTSYREIIDEKGNQLPDFFTTKRLFDKSVIIDGKEFGNLILKNNVNFIGEATTALFRKEDLCEPFGEYKGEKYYGINDLASWMHLLSKGKIAYISDPLSYFRQHPGQNTHSLSTAVKSLISWKKLIQEGRQDCFLEDKKDLQQSANSLIKQSADLLNRMIQSSNNSDCDTIINIMNWCIKELKDEMKSTY